MEKVNCKIGKKGESILFWKYCQKNVRAAQSTVKAAQTMPARNGDAQGAIAFWNLESILQIALYFFQRSQPAELTDPFITGTFKDMLPGAGNVCRCVMQTQKGFLR